MIVAAGLAEFDDSFIIVVYRSEQRRSPRLLSCILNTCPVYKVAIAHVAPVFLEIQANVDKACLLIRKMAQHGTQLVVFAETYIPAFPV